MESDLTPNAPTAKTRIPESHRVNGLHYGRHCNESLYGWDGYYVEPLPGVWLIARLTPADDELVGDDGEILSALRSEAEAAR